MWESQICAENRRKPQIFAGNRRFLQKPVSPICCLPYGAPAMRTPICHIVPISRIYREGGYPRRGEGGAQVLQRRLQRRGGKYCFCFGLKIPGSTLIFFSLLFPVLPLFLETQGKPQKKTRIFYPCRTLKIPGKEGKMLKKTRKSSQGIKTRNSKKTRKGRTGFRENARKTHQKPRIFHLFRSPKTLEKKAKTLKKQGIP